MGRILKIYIGFETIITRTYPKIRWSKMSAQANLDGRKAAVLAGKLNHSFQQKCTMERARGKTTQSHKNLPKRVILCYNKSSLTKIFRWSRLPLVSSDGSFFYSMEEANTMSERVTAVLQWMGGEKGYGFLVEENGQEIFVHYVPLPNEGFRILVEGSKCAFSIVDGPKGPTAANIYQPPAVSVQPRQNRD